MTYHLFDLLTGSAALLAGAGIGSLFGTLQKAALRRNEQRERSGELKNGWSLMPGAGARVAYLLVALALVQLVCPLLFADGTRWLVSAGLLLGYAAVLFQQLRQRLRLIRYDQHPS